ncbi:hypothetical protein Tco_0662008 [Tanacetum coccineum]
MCSKQPNKSHNDHSQDHDTIAEECKTPEEEGKEEKGDPENINTNPPSQPDPSTSFITEKVCKINSFLESLNLDLEKETRKSVYLRNEEYKKRGVEYMMSKILGFYKECLKLGTEYLTGLEDEGGVTLDLLRRSFGVLRSFIRQLLDDDLEYIVAKLSHLSVIQFWDDWESW